MCLLKIQFRRLIDEGIKFLYEALTGRKANSQHRNVKAWWSSALNPSHSKNFDPNVQLTVKQTDDIRFKMCLDLLSDPKFQTDPTYKALVRSGTLQYLTQTSIKLRDEGNFHAHELREVSSFRTALEKAKTDEIIDSICTVEDYSRLQGLINFVEAMQLTS